MEALQARQSDSEVGVLPGGRVVEPLGTKVAVGVSLVLPMFNELACVDATLARAVKILHRQFASFEVVVADDASNDGCTERVQEWTRWDKRIKLVRLSRNQRFGGALRAGLTAAQHEILFYTDFDLPIDLNVLPQLLAEFAEADVLTGYATDENKQVNWRHQVISFAYNFLVRGLFGLRLRDINFGFKAIRRSHWDRLVLRSCSPFLDAELFIKAQRLGLRIKQIPVPFQQRHLGRSHIRRLDVIASTLLDMFRMRLTS
jgi:glycosyltransferase involved in cell wall biosynthesis